VEGAVVWISEHQDDPDIDQEYLVKRKDTIPKVSVVCNDIMWRSVV
jgi:uncharacterized UBP type Zn finger protein